MKNTSAEQEAILGILAQRCSEIHEVEARFGLLMGDGDMRPRIEYFHDAVRAFSNREHAPQVAARRLSVEQLAYDLACMRYVQSMPLAQLRPSSMSLEPGTQLVKSGDIPKPSGKPGREVRQMLADSYTYYSTLFAAIFKPMADRDYHSRIEEADQAIEDLATIRAILQQLQQGKGNIGQLAQTAMHLSDSALETMVGQLRSAKDYQTQKIIAAMQAHVNAQIKHQESESKKAEIAHTQYAMNQLGIYEEGKSIVKTMAAQGLNIAGKFVEQSVTAAQREMGGRGR